MCTTNNNNKPMYPTVYKYYYCICYVYYDSLGILVNFLCVQCSSIACSYIFFCLFSVTSFFFFFAFVICNNNIRSCMNANYCVDSNFITGINIIVDFLAITSIMYTLESFIFSADFRLVTIFFCFVYNYNT